MLSHLAAITTRINDMGKPKTIIRAYCESEADSDDYVEIGPVEDSEKDEFFILALENNEQSAVTLSRENLLALANEILRKFGRESGPYRS